MSKFIVFGLLFVISLGFFAQNHNHSHQIDRTNAREGEDVEYCTQHKKMEILMQDPAFAQKFNAAQAQLAVEEQMLASNQNKAGTVYKVPIVFHVLHNGGNENISREQILDALYILNRDFRKQNADANNVVAAFQGMPSDIEIEFVLATIAPNGQCFSGITRTQSPLTIAPSGNFGGSQQIDAVVNGNDVYQGQWSPSKYLNVIICKDIGGAAGYTFNPGAGGSSMFFNSIFMLHNYTGSIGTSTPFTSRSLTHEVGHWLNLSHTWGSNNNPGNASSCNSDDGVTDTPNTIGVTSCNLSESSCGVLANVENYMDYSYCSKMFTPGQRNRMRAAILSSISGRNNLWKTANLNATGANGNPPLCKADFSVDRQVVCVGNQVHFTDLSYHSVTGVSWSFDGGTPSVSASLTPTVTYNTPGTYAVTLTATDGVSSVSTTRTSYITVVSETGIAPIQEGFEYVSSVPSNDWFVSNPTGGVTWEVTQDAAFSGNKCIKIDNFNNLSGSTDVLESTTITLDLNLSATLSFKYAFAKKDGSNTDRLKVMVSRNCGQTWATKKQLSGSNFTTAPATTSPFVPTASEWKTATISSSSLGSYLTSDFRVKFVFESGGGNNLYLDDINIDGPVTIEENKFLEDLMLYPNPTEGETTLSFYALQNSTDFSIELYDVVGKKMQTVYAGILNSGEQNYQISTTGYAKGIYFIRIKNDNTTVIKKLVIK